MANMNNLKHNKENESKFNFNKENYNSGVSNIVEQFFLRQLKSDDE